MFPHLVNFAERLRYRGSSGSAKPPAGEPLATREAGAIPPSQEAAEGWRTMPELEERLGRGVRHFDGKPSSRNLAASAGAWSARHRRKAIFGWLLFVVAAYLIGMAIGQRNLTDAQMGNGESAQATLIYENAFPYHSGEQVLLQGKGSVHLGNPVYARAVSDLVGHLRALDTVGDIRSPFSAGGAVLRSADGRSMLVTFDLLGDSNQAQHNVNTALAATAATAKAFPQLRVEEFGAASANLALVKTMDGDFSKAEHTSLPVTLIILLFAFGALVAAGVPLLLGMTAVLGALGLIAPLSHLIPVVQGQIEPVVLLIGLAVGVDYSMFYLRRKLEERRAGHDGESALSRAASTSGRAVLISGLTVLTAMAGMFLAGNAIFTSFAMGTMLVVAVAVIGSLTVLPAVMSKLGDKIEKGRVPVIARRRAEGPSRGWGYIVERVLRVPLVSAVLSAGVLLILAVPALGMHTVNPGMVGLPPNLPIMSTYARIQKAFPGAPQSALVVIKAGDVTTPVVQGAIERMSHSRVSDRTDVRPGHRVCQYRPDRGGRHDLTCWERDEWDFQPGLGDPA